MAGGPWPASVQSLHQIQVVCKPASTWCGDHSPGKSGKHQQVYSHHSWHSQQDRTQPSRWQKGGSWCPGMQRPPAHPQIRGSYRECVSGQLCPRNTCGLRRGTGASVLGGSVFPATRAGSRAMQGRWPLFTVLLQPRSSRR